MFKYLGAKEDFCSNILNAKQDFVQTYDTAYSDKPGMATQDNKTDPFLVVATYMPYNSYKVEHGKDACLAVLASDDQGPTYACLYKHTILIWLSGQ